MKPSAVFTPGMLDALRELMNIGVGRAARAIAELSDREVVLHVREIKVLDLTSAGQLAELGGPFNLRVSQRFSGGIEGCGSFVLDRSGAVRLVQLLLGKADHDIAFDELDQGTLLELGNVVVGSAVGMLAAELHVEVRYELPQLQLRGLEEGAELFADIAPADSAPALIMRASLRLRGVRVNGHLTLFFSGAGLEALTTRLARLAP